MGLKRTAKHYRKNKASYKKKLEYDKKYNKKPSSVRKRVELNRINRNNPNSKKGDGLDVSHQKDGGTKLEKASKNRARKEKSRLKGSKRRVRRKSDKK